jgi:uncharacterized membrane protein
MEAVTGQQRMLTPPWLLILLSHLLGVRVVLHSILYLPFGLWLPVITFDTLLSSLFCFKIVVTSQHVRLSSGTQFLDGLHKVHPAYRMVKGGWVSFIGYLLCVINSFYTFRLTFSKLYTVVMDTLKMCMWLFGSVWTFFEKFTCSWT